MSYNLLLSFTLIFKLSMIFLGQLFGLMSFWWAVVFHQSIWSFHVFIVEHDLVSFWYLLITWYPLQGEHSHCRWALVSVVDPCPTLPTSDSPYQDVPQSAHCPWLWHPIPNHSLHRHVLIPSPCPAQGLTSPCWAHPFIDAPLPCWAPALCM